MMMEGADRSHEHRVLVLAMTSGDAELSRTILAEAGIHVQICRDIAELCDRLEVGAGAVVVTEDGLAVRRAAICLAEAVSHQPAWSEVPIILLCGSGADSPLAAWAMENLGSVTVLERPVRITTMVSTLRTALGARQRQYELRDQLEVLRRSEESLRSANERLRLLWEAAAVLLSTDEPDAMLKALFEKIAPHFQLDIYFNFMVAEEGSILRLNSYTGVPPGRASEFSRLAFSEAICGTVAAQRQSIVATHIQQSHDTRAQLAKSLGIGVYACNPLIVGDRLLGTLSFASCRRDEFDAHEIGFLETITHYVTLAYERMRITRALRENDRRKDEFLATLAHELRNPLAPIRAGLELIKVAGNDASLAADVRATMERQVRHMVHLIDDLMDVSRITRGKLALRKTELELSTVVRSAVEATRSYFHEARQSLTLSLPHEPLLVDADFTRLTQVLSNLLNNASKYTPEGGQIRLSVQREAKEAVVSVQDDGIGIPPDMLGRVFEMFAQVGSNSARQPSGLGIGLTLVKSLVELHGGSIRVRSEGAGKGSEFVVRLPLVSTAQLAPAPDEGPVPLPCPRHRVLVVDDNKDAARMLSLTIKLLGSEVLMAHDGHEAVRIAAEARPNVVVMDLGMPGMNGYEAARHLRAEPWGRKLLLIALTGWGQEEDRHRTQAAGFDHHLVKPLEPATLQKLLSEHQVHYDG